MVRVIGNQINLNHCLLVNIFILEDEVRCINKVMQVEETVYEEKVKCQHTFSEKCHDTFITDYVPTQEKKCETSFAKNCHITYKPMVNSFKRTRANYDLLKLLNCNSVNTRTLVN